MSGRHVSSSVPLLPMIASVDMMLASSGWDSVSTMLCCLLLVPSPLPRPPRITPLFLAVPSSCPNARPVRLPTSTALITATNTSRHSPMAVGTVLIRRIVPVPSPSMPRWCLGVPTNIAPMWVPLAAHSAWLMPTTTRCSLVMTCTPLAMRKMSTLYHTLHHICSVSLDSIYLVILVYRALC